MLNDLSKMETMPAGARNTSTSKYRAFMRCKLLIGTPVKSVEGELIGELDDLMFDTTGGAISFVIFQYRDHQKQFIVPYSAVSIDGDGNSIRINSSAKVFENSPGIASTKELTDSLY